MTPENFYCLLGINFLLRDKEEVADLKRVLSAWVRKKGVISINKNLSKIKGSK